MPENRRRITTATAVSNNTDRIFYNVSPDWSDLTDKVKETMEKKKAPAVIKGKKKVGVAYSSFYRSITRFIPDAILLQPEKGKVYNVDMVIFTGGEDISPALYGQDNKFAYSVNDSRDMTEQTIFMYAQNFKKYMVGFCRGHQLLNCLLRGNLHQDYTSSGFKYHPGTHPLESTDGIIGKYFGGKEIISAHHQAVNEIAPGLKPTSYFQGIVESLEGDKIITTQFHPEFESSDTQHVKDFFKFLVEEF